MQQYIDDLRGELKDLIWEMDHAQNAEILHQLEERYHRVKALLNSLAGDENE